MADASCLCCGHVGTPKVSLIDKPEVYVCERCHRRATLPMPEPGFATEAEGDAYTHGWFDGNEAPLSDEAIGAAWEARKQQQQHEPDTPREAFFAGAMLACGVLGTFNTEEKKHE